ncbi:Methyltransferase domain-containing protein [Enhydrobacter aerosaccus]|uniref:Methyltransferase domain-containing protein n=1 Tax=Enhydrobacter aerosaccus TaxID=225324 RepID=A0A1T4K6L5_9HYPH|nr:class I SAM-dependent methyltransferase [Enhydrobacter aerosaccus]SJZ37977.1 Methyltransferase domain-containing protein [Enhydrobacter aerosaccus]
MDKTTLAAYDRGAASFASDWEAQPAPTDLHALVQQYFRPGITADIGCGAGRDTAWLDANGFPAQGFDASEGLLAEARRRYPHLRFSRAMLPALVEIADETFTNVLCETVIMHLAPGDVSLAVRRLLAILVPGGTLYLSWRVTEGSDRRDEHGRLYAAFDPALALTPLASAELLHDEQCGSLSSGKLIRRIVARRTG